MEFKTHHYLILLLLLFLIYIKVYDINPTQFGVNISLIIISLWIVIGFIVDLIGIVEEKVRWLKRKFDF